MNTASLAHNYRFFVRNLASRWLLAWFAFAVAGSVHAHGLAPLLLKIEQGEGAAVQASLKSSVAAPEDILPLFPSGCVTTAPVRTEVTKETRWRYWSLECAIASSSRFDVAVPNLDQYTVVVRYVGADGHIEVALLSANHPRHSLRTGVSASVVGQLWNGIESGFTHLLIGIDHVLFIVGLCLWLRAGRALVMAVTAFTIGHSVTLLLVSLGLLVLPIAWAELAIAASIVMLALKLVNASDQSKPVGVWEVRWLPLVFGLVHGTGFASALKNAGLDGDNLILMVLGFNLGIEVAQLLCVGLVFAVLHWLRRLSMDVRQAAPSAIAYGIGGVAVFWCIERMQVIAA